MYGSPLSRGYWRDAAAELKNPRKLAVAALCIALCIVLGYIPSVALFGGAKITWGYLSRAVCAWVCGPVLGILFGFADDILSFFLTGGGGEPFFPGYTLTTMLGVLIYALCLYRAKLSFWRVLLAKLITNVENVLLGTLWTSILYGKAWYALVPARALKNLILLVPQAILLWLLMRALEPMLKKTKLI